MMEKKIVDQKEYLKKYLSSGHGEDKKKKKKRKMKVGAQTVKIIDDDLDLKNMRPVDENEFDMFVTAEDAPQIAGVVDERGPVDFSDKRRWKIIADDEGGDLTITSTDRGVKQRKQLENGSDNDLSPPRKQKEQSDDDLSVSRLPRRQKGGRSKKSKEDEDGDLSPPRMKHKKQSRSKRNASQNNSDSDSLQTDIPPYKNGKKMKRKGKASDDSDISLPRKSKKHKSKKGIKQRNEDDSDLSPPRKSRRNSDSDVSPPRRSKNYDSDLSPQRKSRREEIGKSMKHTNKDDSDLSPPRKSKRSIDSDTSPPRKTKAYDSDLSPPRNDRKHDYRKKGSDSDLSPPRRKPEKDIHATKYKGRNYESDMNASRQNKKCRDSYTDARRDRCSDLSPQRQHRYKDERTERNRDYRYSEKHSGPYKTHHDANTHLPQNMNKDRDTSSNRFRGDDRDFYKSKPSRFNDRHDRESKYSHRDDPCGKERKSKQRDTDDETGEKRMKKTLDGKTAGLQDARALREETEAHKKREAEQFSKLSKDVTGVGQAAIVRDTKTGRKRNLEAEAAEEREKQKRQAELNAQYTKWGKGLKQVEDREEKLKDDLYEMSKPLARYADDADLDQRLKEQDREGDPMLEYIKQKQIKEGKRKPDRPKYEGSSMPNRFGVKPGHRWDGVDRSNGYEKRWFEAQNAKVARQEEAYKWSTSDM